ncbi:allophanate hydrolase subunit 1 [Neokomagataea thailandica NBRC 106555]|uniref:5-oxoprolinase subunit PxpB n=2 Tax=Neokomagataea TaxID=1223423 RepID=A0A4Y6V9B8_9PROT|nr:MULTISPECIES: 5-oxoprolinase subunit PxpB [Neokomagataea]QDH25250.1 5-oxoprolinase subunit PxpB [Neokomagataea tanensis]GBR54307.1 allophanate hydrolase subunit 1 [Neokomagataea thailandica NBRC 106555]
MRIECAGTHAFLLDMASANFSDDVQTRIWGMAQSLEMNAVVETVIPGANNLLVVFKPEDFEVDFAKIFLRREWENAASARIEPQELTIPVVYGGEGGPDLEHVAQQSGLTEGEVIRQHLSGVYRVAMIGYAPGFGYLTGLTRPLHLPRRASPRLSVPRNSVCVGGVFTCVMPHTAPSGWHIVGTAQCGALFDPELETPCTMRAGDIVRFVRG